jgi:hypothetical protein
MHPIAASRPFRCWVSLLPSSQKTTSLGEPTDPVPPVRILAALVAALTLAGCAAVPTPSASPPVALSGAAGHAPTAGLELHLAPDPALQALIDPPPTSERRPVWLGGDIASSIEVSPGRFVWLFGDTLVGTLVPDCATGPPGCRVVPRVADPDSDVIANSTGVMEISPPDRPRPIVKYWRTEGGRAAPILATAAPDEILWPLAAVRVGGKLLLAVSRHSRAGGLAPLGNLFVRVHDPGARPDRWRYDVHAVPGVRAGIDETAPLTWTTALVPHGGHLYVVGQLGAGIGAYTVLARMALDEVGRAAWEPQLEYLLASGADTEPTWGELSGGAPLYVLPGLPGTSESTFQHRNDLGWVTFQIPPFAFEIHAYTAPELYGPWSDRGVVYRIPPPWSTAERTDCLSPEIACGWERFAAYAVKSHPELAPPGGFALTYNVNLLFGTLAGAARAAKELDGFYVPQMVAGGSPPL